MSPKTGECVEHSHAHHLAKRVELVGVSQPGFIVKRFFSPQGFPAYVLQRGGRPLCIEVRVRRFGQPQRAADVAAGLELSDLQQTNGGIVPIILNLYPQFQGRQGIVRQETRQVGGKVFRRMGDPAQLLQSFDLSPHPIEERLYPSCCFIIRGFDSRQRFVQFCL